MFWFFVFVAFLFVNDIFLMKVIISNLTCIVTCIASKGTPSRWAAMDRDLEFCFREVMAALAAVTAHHHQQQQQQHEEGKSRPTSDTPATSSTVATSPTAAATAPTTTLTAAPAVAALVLVTSASLLDDIVNKALKLFYYWVCFAPLSRGCAMCGYIAFVAIIVASGNMITSAIPTGVQMDWEAIFATDFMSFTTKMKSWIEIKPLVDCNIDFNGVNIENVFATFRDMIYVLNA